MKIVVVGGTGHRALAVPDLHHLHLVMWLARRRRGGDGGCDKHGQCDEDREQPTDARHAGFTVHGQALSKS